MCPKDRDDDLDEFLSGRPMELPEPPTLSEEEVRRNIEYYSGGPPVKVAVPQGCIAVYVHGYSLNDHWASYQIHASDFDRYGFGEVRILRQGEKFTFPWCPNYPDEEFNYRFSEVTVSNENGVAKKTVRITDIVPCDYD